MATTTAENEAVARRFLEEVCDGRRADVAAEVMTADHAYHDPHVPAKPGPEGMLEALQPFQDGLEGHWELREMFSSGDTVTMRWTGRGRHSGEVMGIPPTDREVFVEAISLLKFRDGKIAENFTMWDTLGMLQQLGVVPNG